MTENLGKLITEILRDKFKDKKFGVECSKFIRVGDHIVADVLIKDIVIGTKYFIKENDTHRDKQRKYVEKCKGLI